MTLALEKIDVLLKCIGLISKTVKGDLALIYHILFNGLSTFTSKPTHLMVMERSSEGKTYPVLQIAQHFPKENVITLGSVTPQAFKYDYGIIVDKNYHPIQEKLDHLDEQIKQAKKLEKDSGSTDVAAGVSALLEQKRQLEGEARYLIDLRNKWIIFKEPPDQRLLEALYSTLSSDEEYSEHRFVNKESGQNKTFKVVFRGTPAILVCTAKDESKNSRWDETFTRFNIISPTSSSQKYREGMELIAKLYGLPKELRAEHIISNEEKTTLSILIGKLIQQIQESGGEIINPFLEELHKQFPQEAGYRWRQFKRFLTMVDLHCMCYSHCRPKLVINGRIIPVVTKADVIWAFQLMKDYDIVPPNKMQWFREIFLPAWRKYGKIVEFGFGNTLERKVVIGNDIRTFQIEHNKKQMSVKQIRESYLETLIEHGIVEKEQDPSNKTRDTYWPTEGYEDSASSLIAISSLDESCVSIFKDKYLKGRFEFEFNNRILNDNEIIQYILSDKNVIDGAESEFKFTNGGTTINDC